MAIHLCFLFASFTFIFLTVSADNTSNPADELVTVLNNNRTANKLPALVDNPGLACMALQYIKAYQGNCDEIDNKKPPEADFAQNFAPNCGVEASTLAPITGRILSCQSKYLHAADAFSDVMIKDDKSLEILYNKNHTQVGAGVSGSDGGSPYFWCVLFSSGAPNSTFVLEGGTAKVQRPGCYSGTNDTCSGADVSYHHWAPAGLAATGVIIVLSYVLGL